MTNFQVVNGHIIGWVRGTTSADVAWWVKGQRNAERKMGFRDEAEVLAFLAAIEADPDRSLCWTALRTIELTSAELAELPDGAVVHWTNWPGRPSVPVTCVRSGGGNIRFGNGKMTTAMHDELTRVPRAGLEA
jgi:hypothetical protein